MQREGAACERAGRPVREPCQIACDLGHSNSCHRLGAHLERGEDGARDLAAAEARYREACRGGSGLGCAALARLSPSGGDDLFAQARRYARVHCEQDHVESCRELARILAAGEGGPVDPGGARLYAERARELDTVQRAAATRPGDGAGPAGASDAAP